MTARRARANPTKSFFVRMLTRDISLDDCILDLVDNSIDGAWALSGDRPSLQIGERLKPYTVAITIEDDSFVILDDCGGITLDAAADYAFTFGREDEEAEPDTDVEPGADDGPDQDASAESGTYSVGVYGIGMKRAVFKIGRTISIRSTYIDDDRLASFEVPIDVTAWLADTAGSWDFPIEPSEDLPKPGVRIKVTDLAAETRDRFKDETYAASLRRVLARDYLLPLMHGLTITVNGVAVQGRTLELRDGGAFRALRERYEDGGVTVEILAGMGAPPPDESSPDESDRSESAWGWYVLCNGRAVLAADTTAVTGWGVGLPKWHNQYSGFLGLVLFTAQDTVLLPMTTTKRGVDVSSAVYRRALGKMTRPARAWVDYTNDRKHDPESAKHDEEAAQPVSITVVADSPRVVLPKLVRPPAERIANINYARPLKQVRRLATQFGYASMSYRDVGLNSFQYAYDNLVDEEAE